MSAQEQYRAFIRRCPYVSDHRNRIVNDLVGISSSFPLRAKLIDQAEGDRVVQLCALEGTLPISMEAQNYSIPIMILFTEKYPLSAPQLCVCPTKVMSIKANQLVSQTGEILHSELSSWNSKSSLRQILEKLQVAFAEQCPVYISTHYHMQSQAVEEANARILAVYERMRTTVVEECKAWEATKQHLIGHSNVLQAQLQQTAVYQQRAREKAVQLARSSQVLEQTLVQVAYQPRLSSSEQDLQPANPLQQALLALVAAEQAVVDTTSLLEGLLNRRQIGAETAFKELKTLYTQQFLLQRKQEKAACELLSWR